MNAQIVIFIRNKLTIVCMEVVLIGVNFQGNLSIQFVEVLAEAERLVKTESRQIFLF